MYDSFLTAVDLYCERTGPEFWSEPVNALSNLVFVIAGLWGLGEIRKRRAGLFAEALAWWVVAIGIGSFLFHTFANRAMIWADVVPIAGFTLAYTLLNLRRFMNLGWPKALAIFFGFYALAGLLTWSAPDWLRLATNGSTGYLPPFLALVFFGTMVIASGNRAGWHNILAAGIFCVSVTFRAIDPQVCGAFPVGSHFLWHLINGLMLAVILDAVARYGAADPSRRQT